MAYPAREYFTWLVTEYVNSAQADAHFTDVTHVTRERLLVLMVIPAAADAVRRRLSTCTDAELRADLTALLLGV